MQSVLLSVNLVALVRLGSYELLLLLALAHRQLFGELLRALVVVFGANLLPPLVAVGLSSRLQCYKLPGVGITNMYVLGQYSLRILFRTHKRLRTWSLRTLLVSSTDWFQGLASYRSGWFGSSSVRLAIPCKKEILLLSRRSSSVYPNNG